MYRRGPSRATPASVKCQKCLKNGHYSYECKASLQERPYIARPSRSQQLANPKLVPKLTEATPPELQKKQGVADEQLAKLEAERARKKELESRDDDHDDNSDRAKAPQRRRSMSYDSVSTVSTRDSPGPVRARDSRSPSPARRDVARSSLSPADERDTRRSPGPLRRGRDASAQRGYSRESRSPSPRSASGAYRRYSSSPSRSPPPPENQRRYRSRSPRDDRNDNASHPPRRRDAPETGASFRADTRRGPTSRGEARDRSLSPFSKRLALTRTMNHGN